MKYILILTIAAVFGFAAMGCTWHKPVKPNTTCQEDMPCWNCHTMGNKICGTKTDAMYTDNGERLFGQKHTR